MKIDGAMRRPGKLAWLLGVAILVLTGSAGSASAQCTNANTKTANVVALDQPWFWNRLGAVQPQGQIFALRRNVIAKSGVGTAPLVAGQVMLKKEKRPRPLVLRMNVGDCLQINFTNLINPNKDQIPDGEEQPRTRDASIRGIGLQLVGSIASDGSYVGKNASSVVAPGGSAVYTFYAEREGTHLLYSQGTTTGGEGDGGQLNAGLFGAVTVEPSGSEYYRSQVTAEVMATVSTFLPNGNRVINYQKLETPTVPYLKMVNVNKEIVHSDLTAIVTGPNAGPIQPTYPLVKVNPNRQKPFREFTIIYHDEVGAVQAFPHFKETAKGLVFTLHGVRDAFAFNYGTGGIGAEILANRLGVGPMHDCAECFYEEFFLSAWAVGDPAQVVDVPANAPCKVSQLHDPDQNGTCDPTPGPKAKMVLYPDDPSNVYHSYIGDHTKFRILHGGSKEHHIHHLHAHQWLRTPDGDNSSYLDSQALGPGYSFTTDIAYNGSGNRNQVVGDSIFHCHFYPHFAMGMWALWRSHDVFEAGTVLDATGKPAPGSRALPDGEIAAGTPIPGLVPLPTYAMAPNPQQAVSIVNGQVVYGATVPGTDGNPGYPFFIPGLAGHRPPSPPMDFAKNPNNPTQNLDGGLPRHIIRDGTFFAEANRLSFDKFLLTADAVELADGGTDSELRAMAFHARASHTTQKPDGTAGTFITNGKPAVQGAPYADPCKGDPITPNPPIRQIVYRAAAVQFDLAINKVGWHFPQTRILTLWNDVMPTITGQKPAEPFFFRGNTYDCINFWHTNLMPRVYQQDDFQVRTPTDVIGQHIHLVKFDVTSSDGSGNGFNYEDGTLSPDEVRDAIHAINLRGGIVPPNGGPRKLLVPKMHPFFNQKAEWVGAQTTVQRWFVDDTLNQQGVDRTLQTVFTHDHFGPSTHQQIGLYAGLIIEKQGSAWRNDETGVALGNSPGNECPPGSPLGCDGFPTSWRAIIRPPNVAETFREFLFEFADFHQAYYAGGGVNANGEPIPDHKNAINPPAKEDAALPINLAKIDPNQPCPNTVPTLQVPNPNPPCPEAIAAADPGTTTINYRNEPVPVRIWDPQLKQQAAGLPGDLSYVFRSRIVRKDPLLNLAPNQWQFVKPLSNGVLTGDPATPLLRAYQKDNIRIRVLVGAHEEGHNFSINGNRWFFEPNVPSSGYKNSQMMGISEHYEMLTNRIIHPSDPLIDRPFVDFLYAAGSATDDLWNGSWGIFRLYENKQTDLAELDNNALSGHAPVVKSGLTTRVSVNLDADNDPNLTTTVGAVDVPPFSGVLDPTDSIDGGVGDAAIPIEATGVVGIFEKGACPLNAPFRIFDVTAARARDILPVNIQTLNRTLIYNRRLTTVSSLPGEPPDTHTGPLHDPTAIMYVRTRDLVLDQGVKRLRTDVKVEPLVLRANAGDCIAVILRNMLPANTPLPNDPGWNTLPLLFDDLGDKFRPFNTNQIVPSPNVGLHPQLLTYNAHRSDGNNVGFNRVSTAAPNGISLYLWYAGTMNVATNGSITFTPVEFGATNLIPADRIKHPNKGAIGSLIIEPPGSTYLDDTFTDSDGGIKKTRGSATITPGFGGAFREFVLMHQTDVNLQYRDGTAVKNLAGEDDPEDTGQRAFNYRTEPLWFRMGHVPQTPPRLTRELIWTNVLSNIKIGNLDPETPIFPASPGSAVRFRVLDPGGHSRNNVFTLHGHIWEEEPWNSTGTAQAANLFSEWKGAQFGVGSTFHDNFLLKNGAGGKSRVAGDYLYRTFSSTQFDMGLWGLFRVTSLRVAADGSVIIE